MNNLKETRLKKQPIRTITFEDIKNHFEEAMDTINAILIDYVEPISLVEDVDLKGLETEVKTALESLQSDLQKSTNALSDEDADNVLNELDSDDIKDFALNDFDICVTCTDNNIRTKLEEFIKTEIYPYVLDQNKYTNL